MEVKATVSRMSLLVAQNFKKIRLHRGMTQAEVAKRLSVGTSTVSKIELAYRANRIDTLQKYAEALGTDAYVLLVDDPRLFDDLLSELPPLREIGIK